MSVSIKRGAASLDQRVRVDLADRAYDVIVGNGLIDRAGELIAPLVAAAGVAVISDATVDALYGQRLRDSLAAAGIAASSIVMPVGEATKDFAFVRSASERLLAAGIERRTIVVALGGGVIGDLAGFVAGILLRGLDFVQIPTTLLAQVDSSVGGKTGIDTPQGKNLVGLFHEPRLVIADMATLDTLDSRQLRAGYAEVVKYGLIADEPFFRWLESNGAAVIAGDAEARRHAVITSCAAKAAIVAADEREAGQRALLNLGHTFGHALEAETGFGGALLHGEAVAIGMVLASDLSVQLGLCPPDTARQVREHLEAVGLPTTIATPGITAPALLNRMRRDKKVRDGRMTFVLATGIGRAFISQDVPMEAVRTVLERSLDS